MTTPNTQSLQWSRAFKSALRVVLLSYLGTCILLLAMESRLVYHPPTPRNAVDKAQRLGGEEVWFAAEDQTKLHGWYFPRHGSPRAFVYFHGNGEDADLNIDMAAELRDRLNASVFIFDYRGYGHSEGSPYEKGVISDGIAAQRWLAEKSKLDTDEIILYGRSLGGGVAIAAAEQLGARAIIVHGTFANMCDVAAGRYWFMPVRSLMRNPYLSQQRIRQYRGPFLQFHGTDDIVIPVELARPLCDAAPSSSKQFVEIPGGGHNEPLPDYCFDMIAEFVDSLP